jgi:C-terminal peptidase prc
VSEDFKQRVTEELLKDTSHLGLVLDLRGNPGGYLEEAVGMGSMFVGSKPIVGVLEEGKTRVLKEETGNLPLYQKPLVVLVDPGSASAAEVLSGALKDYQRAIIVGSPRTYGKGTVQKLFHLEDPLLFASNSGPLGTGVVKLTTSVFYSPLGHTPANGGVTADIVLNDKNKLAGQVNKIGDILPIVDNDLRLELEKGSESHQSAIQFLSEKSQERVAGAEIKSADSELDEAVAIVSDLADLKTF